MSYFQRIKGIIIAALLLILAAIMFVYPKQSYYIVAAVLGLSLLVYGFHMLWFYFTMARNMVGGKTSLYQAIIVLDLALFTGSVTTMSNYIIIIYLLGVYAFSGFIEIARAVESKRFSSPNWKYKLINGLIMVFAAVALTVFGMVKGNLDLLVYGYAVSLVYTAIMRIVTSLRKTAIVYIQ